MAAKYTFSVDWGNDGSFLGPYDDVSPDVLEEANITYGRDQARALSPIATGSTAFELTNTTRRYSPENTSSPLNGVILPARPMRIQAATALLNTNTDFETGTSGWLGFLSSTIAQSSAFAHRGTWSGKLTSDAGSDPRVEATNAAISGSTPYQWSGYLYSPISLPTQVHVGVNWSNGGGYLSTSATSITLSPGVWTGVVGTATSPGTATNASIRFGFTGTPGSGKIVYGDDMELTTVPVTLFRGHLDEFNVIPVRGERKVNLTGLDALAKIHEAKATTTLYPSIRTGAAIAAILDAIGWSGSARDLDTGATTLRWWSVNNVDAWTAVQDIVSAEGSPALITSDSSGNVVFRDRHHRLVRSASTTSQVTLRDTGSEPKFSEPLVYDQGWRDVVNDVSFTVDEKGPASELSVVWSSDLTYVVAVGQTVSFTVTTESPFFDMVSPSASGGDYVVLSGSASVSIDQDLGQSVTISITEGGGGATVTGLRLRAYEVTTQRTLQVTATDSASITAYGSKAGPDGAGAACYEDAQAIANLAVAYRAIRLPIVSLDVIGSNATRLAQCFGRNLSDRVTVVDAETGLNRAFYLEQITHKIIQAGLLHTTVFGCEAISTNGALDSPTGVFIFDHATQGKFGTGKFAT
jgi:hypothetical protein